MNDQKFLWWIHERLRKVYGEPELCDFMHHLRAVIVDLPEEQDTPTVARMDTDADVLRKKFGGVR